MSIGVFIIATGAYIKYLDDLYPGLKRYFIPKHDRTVYVFTDSETVPDGCVRVPCVKEKWPYPTLKRYHYITEFCDSNNIRHDYYYYIDADMLIVDFVGDEILGGMVATLHPGFYHKKKEEFAHERRFISQAFTPTRLIKHYYAGAVNGGRNYLDMARQIVKWTNKDLKYGFIPEWNDESYLNKYLALYPPDVSLDPSYCYPRDSERDIRDWGLEGIKPKIVCIYK